MSGFARLAFGSPFVVSGTRVMSDASWMPAWPLVDGRTRQRSSDATLDGQVSSCGLRGTNTEIWMSRLTSKLRSFAHKKSKQYSRKNLYEFVHHAAKSAKERGGRCLNIGSGGEIENILRQHGLDIVSVDIDPDRNPDLVMDACRLAFEDGAFETVFLFEVLEHVPEPHLAVAEFNRVLKPGGKLFCSTPFVFGIHDAPHDYFRYTKYGLAHLYRQFQNLEIKERNSYYETVCVLMLRLSIVPHKPSRNFGLLTAVAMTVLAPVVALVARTITNTNITTGYTLEAIRAP